MKQFRPGYFKTYQLLKKTGGDFGVLGITRFLDFLLGYWEMVSKSVLNCVVNTSCYDIN